MKEKPETIGHLRSEMEKVQRQIAKTNADKLRRKDVEKVFQKNESIYHHIVDNISDGVYRINEEGHFTFVNRVIANRAGIPAGKFRHLHFLDLVMPEHKELAKNNFEKVMKGEEGIPYELSYRRADGRKNTVEVHSKPIYEGDRVTGLLGISRDITERRRAQESLREAYDHLELLVVERTQELLLKNRQLMEEIAQRRDVEESLVRRERDLEEKTRTLEELNCALKVLLKQRDKDRYEFEEWVKANVQYCIMPYVEKMKTAGLGNANSACIKIIEANLKNITSSFSHNLSMKYLNLTFKEFQIADLVKEGNSSKDIAEILNVSERTIGFHRKNIRKKLAIADRKTNLRTYLARLS
jgi:PAS domain S-box-containing protein